MLIESLLGVVFGLIDFLISLIPTIELPDEFFSSLDDLASLVSGMSYVLPVDTFLMCLSVIFILQSARLFVSIFNFIVRKIPNID